MAQTNTVSVFVQMTTVTAIGREIVPNCSSSDCVVPSAKCSAGHSRSKMSARHRGDRHTVSSQVMVTPVRADTCRPSPTACRRCACEPEASEVLARLA